MLKQNSFKRVRAVILAVTLLALLPLSGALAAPGDFIRTWGWGVDTGASAFEICTPGSTPCYAGVSGGGNVSWAGARSTRSGMRSRRPARRSSGSSRPLRSASSSVRLTLP